MSPQPVILLKNWLLVSSLNICSVAGVVKGWGHRVKSSHLGFFFIIARQSHQQLFLQASSTPSTSNHVWGPYHGCKTCSVEGHILHETSTDSFFLLCPCPNLESMEDERIYPSAVFLGTVLMPITPSTA